MNAPAHLWGLRSKLYSSWGYLSVITSSCPAPPELRGDPCPRHCSSWPGRRGRNLQGHPAQGCPARLDGGLRAAGSNCWQWASHKHWGTGGSGSLSCPIPRHGSAHAACEHFVVGKFLVKAVQFGIQTNVRLSISLYVCTTRGTSGPWRAHSYPTQVSPSHSTCRLLIKSYFARK